MQRARETEHCKRSPPESGDFFMPETTKLHPKQPVAAALASRAAVRPALRQGGAFALGLAGGWAVLYGALLPFGLGLTLGLPADCFAACAAGAALSILFHGSSSARLKLRRDFSRLLRCFSARE